MRLLAISLSIFLLSCGVDNDLVFRNKFISIFNATTDNNYEYLTKDVLLYTSDLLSKLQDNCGINYDLNNQLEVYIEEKLPYQAGALFYAPNQIYISSETAETMLSFYGHELVRFILFQKQNRQWSQASNQKGWQSQYLGCSWHTAENLSLCYINRPDLTYRITDNFCL